MTIRSTAGLPRDLPLVGRSHDLAQLRTLLGDAEQVEPLYMLTGESGVGKSRMAEAVLDEARRTGWSTVAGRAYPVEAGVPYAVFSDAFVPFLKGFDTAQLTVLTRGNDQELQRLFPALGTDPIEQEPGADPSELRTRLFWSFAELLKRVGQRQPLLVVLEDLHWAAPSTLGLLHFLVRQLDDQPVRFLATYNTDYREDNEALIGLERSLLSLRQSRMHNLRALTAEDATELLSSVFGVQGEPASGFSRILYGWTKGNPYFIEQTLDQLLEAGRLYERDGVWLGWESRDFELPSTIREAVFTRLHDADEEAVDLAETLAAAGGRGAVSILARAAGLSSRQMVAATETLLRLRFIRETDPGDRSGVLVEFRHPLVREALYRRLSLTRRAALHGRMAEALESTHGPEAAERADELAYHFSRAGGGEPDQRALRYLIAAGHGALDRHADKEAATYLEEALVRLDDGMVDQQAGEGAFSRETLRASLARAHGRLGHYDEARSLWHSVLDTALDSGDPRAVGQAYRHLALLSYWAGDHREALEFYRHAVEAVAGEDPAIEARLHLAAGVAMQEVGRPAEAQELLQLALPLARTAGDESLLARVHRALALLHTWVGEADLARQHSHLALKLAKRSGDRLALFWARWGLSALEGLTGDTKAMHDLLTAARVDADELASPVLRLWVTELAVKYAWATGDWDGALAEGEAGISLAKSINQKVILSRLMVWTAVVYLGKGDLERASVLCEEAWTVSGADRTDPDVLQVHAVIPAHIGRTAWAMSAGNLSEAVQFGEAALQIASDSGYVTWVLDLIPLLLEAYVRSDRLDEAAAAAKRIRTEADRMGHSLARAWATACEALVEWRGGSTDPAIDLLKGAAEALERIPIRYDAMRIRRQLAGRFAEVGRRDEALVQLRMAHDVFTSLGAEPELRSTREMFREVGSRPPSRSGGGAAGDLTAREVEIALLVAKRASNKSISKELGIAARTVTTHLSNIYRKLGVSSRGEVAEMVRDARLPRRR
ncbi:MAG: helix-turn-helix transcriptional regulator [Longimicrobiales bacterium]